MIQFEEVTYGYTSDFPAVQDVSFQLLSGSFLLLLGHNGAGKSTLLKLLNGILKPTHGKILVNGLDTSVTPTAQLARHVAVTFQNPGDQLFASTVKQEVEFGPKNLRRADTHELVEEALRLFHLSNLKSTHPYDLAPAQRKLLAAASAVATDAPILAFDEPSTGLSQTERKILCEAITHLTNQSRTFIVVSHDLDLFLPLTKQVIVLSSRRTIFDGQPDELVKKPRILRAAGLRLPTVMRLGKILDLRLGEQLKA